LLPPEKEAGMKTEILLLLIITTTIFAVEQYYERGELQTLTPVAASVAPSIAQVSMRNGSEAEREQIQWFFSSGGRRVGVTGTIIVKWVKKDRAEQVLEDLGLVVSENITEQVTVVNLPSGADVFELSRILYLDPATEYAHPDMIRPRSMR